MLDRVLIGWYRVQNQDLEVVLSFSLFEHIPQTRVAIFVSR